MSFNIHSRRMRLAVISLFLLAAVAAVYAQAKPSVKVKLVGTVLRAGKEITLAEAKSVRPGEVLNWTLTSRNEGGAPALGYRTTAPMPTGTSYVEGSASGEEAPQITFSINGGRDFSPQPMIEEKQADGSIKTVPAPVTLYTHIRYAWNGSLASGSAVSATYKVQVK